MLDSSQRNLSSATGVRMTDLLRDTRTLKDRWQQVLHKGLPALLSSIVLVGIFLASMVLVAKDAIRKNGAASPVLEMRPGATNELPKLESDLRSEVPQSLDPTALPKVPDIESSEVEFDTAVNDVFNPNATSNAKFGMSEANGAETDSFTPTFGGFGNPNPIGLGAGSGPGGGGAHGKLDGGTRSFGKNVQIHVNPSGDRAVNAALDWLRRHQNPDGSWSAAGYTARCESKLGAPCNGRGSAVFDVGVSGLALLAFLGAGFTPNARSEYSDVVRNGLKFLKSVQDEQGAFGSRGDSRFTYSHACATIAMCEAAGLTRQHSWKKSAEQAMGFVSQAQNPYQAWRYGVRPGDNDSSVTGWMLMAYHSAREANIPVNERSMKDGLAFIDSITDEDSGRTGYTKKGELPVRPENLLHKFPATESEALTAVAMCARIFCDDTANPLMAKGADLLGKRLPTWDAAAGKIDMYYWYYGTLAMYQLGGSSWDAWNKAMKVAVIDSQRGPSEGCNHGSWDPIDAWGDEGGRVYSTAIMALCLEVYYRFPRVFGAKARGSDSRPKATEPTRR